MLAQTCCLYQIEAILITIQYCLINIDSGTDTLVAETIAESAFAHCYFLSDLRPHCRQPRRPLRKLQPSDFATICKDPIAGSVDPCLEGQLRSWV